jgi:hypothetical protein
VEPSPEFIVIGLICFEMVVCLLASAAGGWMAKVALKRDLNNEQ